MAWLKDGGRGRLVEERVMTKMQRAKFVSTMNLLFDHVGSLLAEQWVLTSLSVHVVESHLFYYTQELFSCLYK